MPQLYNNLQEEKCPGVKGPQHQQIFSNTKDSKQEITQNETLFSSVKESQDNGKYAVNILEFLRKHEEIYQILSRVKQFEVEPDKNGLKTFQTLLSIIPVWLLSEEKRKYGVRTAVENNIEKIKEEITHIKARAEDMLVSCESVIHTAMTSSKAGKQRNKPTRFNETSSKVSSVNVSCNKNTEQKENTILEETEHHQRATHHEATAQNQVKTHQIKLDDSKISPPS